MESFKLRVVTPTREFYTGEVSMVELTTINGNIGIYAKHIPMTSIIAPGILRIHESDTEVKTAALMSGFVEVLEERVTILAEVCEWPEEIDEGRAREAEKRARRRLERSVPDVDVLRAEMALKRALVRIRTKNH